MCVCFGGGGGREVKALLQLANFTLGPDDALNIEIHKNTILLIQKYINRNDVYKT